MLGAELADELAEVFRLRVKRGLADRVLVISHEGWITGGVCVAMLSWIDEGVLVSWGGWKANIGDG